MPDKKIQFEQPSSLLIFFNRFWIVITAILVGALLLGGYYFLVKPKMDQNDLLRDNALQVQTDRQNSEQLLKNLKALESAYQDIVKNRQADLDRLKAMVPTNPQVAEIFVVSDRLARQYGFQLLDINISDAEEKKKTPVSVSVSTDEDGNPVNPAPTTATSTTASKNTIALKTLSINFQVSPIARQDESGVILANAKTNYQLFKDFLDALEKNLRLTDIQTVNFSSLQEGVSSAPQFQFSVQTYYR